MTAEDIQNSHEFAPSQNSKDFNANRIKVIGVGGGGNNAINHMYNLGIRDVSFVVANTDSQALRNSPVPTKILLGPKTLRGRGAGNEPEKAHAAAEESVKEINDVFDDETDMVFITAGMGGGTGTGASPVIARVARERNILTIGIVSIPFLFEGQKKIIKALNGAQELAKYVDALLVINNERLSEIYRDMDFLSAFGKADDILTMAAMSISEIVTSDGYINLDFNDVDNTLRNGGTAIISTGYGEGENRVTKAIEDAINSPLLRNTDIFTSRKLLFNLYYSRDAKDQFKIDETRQLNEFISNIDHDVDVIWGVGFDESLGDKVKLTILAAGFEITVNETAVISAPAAETKSTEEINIDSEGQTRMIDAYGIDKVDEMNKTMAAQRYIILAPDQFDDDRVINVLEENAAFNRDRRIISDLKKEKTTAAPAPQQAPAKPADSAGTIEFNDFE